MRAGAAVGSGPARERRSAHLLGRRLGWLESSGILILAAFGALIRAHGFSNLDLWHDDAATAASARVGLAQALHVGLAAPGYFLALRPWFQLHPLSTTWLQIPGFVLGVAAIPVTWLLLSWMRLPRWAAVGGAVATTVMPIMVQYSTRVKEYPFDFLAGCALLALHELVRRSPSVRSFWALAVASSLAVFASGSCGVVVVGVWLVVGLQVAQDRSLWRSALLAGSATFASCLAVWMLFLRHLPSALRAVWRYQGFLFDLHSRASIEKSISLVFGGFVHGALGVPTSQTFFRFHLGFHSLPVTAAGLVIFGVVILVPGGVAVRARSVTPALSSVVILTLAVLLTLAGVSPLGDGRTDEIIYPAFLVCLATTVAATGPWWRRLGKKVGRARRPLAASAASLLVVGALSHGALHPANYPALNLRGLVSELHPHLDQGDLVAVAPFNAYTWCYDELSRCTINSASNPQWPLGPKSRQKSVFIPTNFVTVLPQLTVAQSTATRIWYIGYDYGTYEVSAITSAQDRPVPTQMLRVLRRDGWVPATTEPGQPAHLEATHVYAQLLVRRSAT